MPKKDVYQYYIVIFADRLNYDLLYPFSIQKLKRLQRQIYLISWVVIPLFCGMPLAAFAQHSVHLHEHPVLMSIEQARETGTLSADEAMLQMFYAAYQPEQLDGRFERENDSAPIKCMVPLAQQFIEERANLQASTISEIDGMMQSTRADEEFSYVSPSGVFEFHYDTTGSDAVSPERTLPGAIDANIPDYIYKAAFAADSSYRYQVEELGFTDFSESSPYDIYFSNFGFYGTTTTSGSTTYITIHNSFNGFPENSHPEGHSTGALYATIAHEIKHAIQYEANRWRGSAGNFNWIEMDATMMEEVVFDDVNDYYNYIKTGFHSTQPSFTSIFGNPQNPTPGAYYHTTWMLYFAEEYDIEFWVDVWSEIESNPEIPFIDAIELSLSARSETFGRSHVRNHLWHLGSGETFTDASFGFREKEFYPDPFTEFDLFSIPDSLTRTGLRSLGANYIRANAPNIAIGQPNVQLQSTAQGVGVGVIGVFTDGSVQNELFLNENTTTQQIQTQWNWNELQDLYIAVVNTNRNRSADYTLTLDSVLPDEDILARNYPNPFNPSTRIEFSINSTKNVKLDVFDSIGRKVETLLNRRLNEGFHFVDFDGSALASGVYFYRISTNEQTITQKMLLVK